MLTFNLFLRSLALDPASIRLLRHEAWERGRTSYALWRDDRKSFEDWQSIQLVHRRGYFSGSHWASFVVAPDGKTIFAGLYEVQPPRPPEPGRIDPFSGGELDAEWVEIYPTQRCEIGSAYVGRLAIEWGAGTRTWVQRAANQDKLIVELRPDTIDPPFPGYAAFACQLSDIASLPPGWRSAFSSVSGVYLLTCPRTSEQYVGSATGTDGFLGRWLIYTADGHGGNQRLRSREPSDYRVSILQVAGSADDRIAIQQMEVIWKAKLQSREMGLNAN